MCVCVNKKIWYMSIWKPHEKKSPIFLNIFNAPTESSHVFSPLLALFGSTPSSRGNQGTTCEARKKPASERFSDKGVETAMEFCQMLFITCNLGSTKNESKNKKKTYFTNVFCSFGVPPSKLWGRLRFWSNFAMKIHHKTTIIAS